MTPHLYKLNHGDIFTVDIKTFSKNAILLNPLNFQILGIKQIRPRRLIHIFKHRFNIPKPYKIWVVQVMSI